MPTTNSFNNQINNAYNQIILNAGTNGVAISTDASAATVNVATGGAVKTSTFGSTNSTSATTVQSGSGALNVTATGGALTVNSGVGALGISTDASATTLSIGTGGAIKTVTVGSTNSTSVTTIACGTGGANFGTSANAHATVVGSTTAASTTTIQAPSAGVILTGVQGIAVANKNYVTINTSTGAIGSDAGPSSSISITGDTGGALTGSSFTFTGGTTGLSFGGSGTTETLTFAGITANGGTVSLATDATTSTVNVGTGAGAKTVTLGSTNTTSLLALKYGTADFTLASATGTVMSALDTGEITYPLQPAFLATLTNTATNVTGDGTAYTVIYDNEIYDQNSDFNLGTSTFTAPVTGRYHFCVGIFYQDLGAAFTDLRVNCNTSNRIYLFIRCSPSVFNTSGFVSIGNSSYADMDASDTATITAFVAGSTKTVDLLGDANAANFFSGALEQ